MPPLIGLALIGAALWAGARTARYAFGRSAEDMAKAPSKATGRDGPDGALKDLGALEFDPASGVWRPRQ